MSDSPKPSAPAGISDPAFEAVMPAGLFFEAGDYTVANARPEDLALTRRNVSRYRSKLKAKLVLQVEDLGKINTSLHAADRQGNAAPHWDSAVALAHKLLATVQEIASTIDKAERRYEETFLAEEAANIDDQAPAA